MKCLFLTVASLLLVVPGFILAEQRLPDNPVEGAKLFSEKNCVRCHSIRGKGGRIGHDLGRIELGSAQLDVATHMLNNAQTMAAKMRDLKVVWPHLTGGQMESVIAYIYYVNYFDEMGLASKGEKLFVNRGCNRCHLSSSPLSKGAPPLLTFPRNISPIFLANALWNHGPKMHSEIAHYGMAWPKFEGTEMMDLVAYIRGVARGESSSLYYAPGNPNEGKEIFKTKGCPLCHGGKTGGEGPNLADPSRNLQKSLTQVVTHMWNHAPSMFSRMQGVGMKVPEFTEKEIADLVAYLYFLNYVAPPADLALGQALFTTKQCSSCHSLGGGLEGIGPDLAASKQVSSPIDIVAAMWNHAPFMQTLMQEKQISWPTFEKGALNHLVGYINSMRRSPTK